MVIGIAGKSCAGKNVASEILSKKGFFHVDADKLGNIALAEKREEIEKTFSISLPIIDNKIDRQELAHRVFSSPSELSKLESILFPAIHEKTIEILKTNQNVVVNGVKLFESELFKLCDFVFWIDAPTFVRLRRAKKRDSLTKKQILARFLAQNELSAQPWEKMVDIYNINNVGLYCSFKHKVLRTLTIATNRRKRHEQQNYSNPLDSH